MGANIFGTYGSCLALGRERRKSQGKDFSHHLYRREEAKGEI